ncbi:hypothetical protein [Bacillus chungangensis]|uniref:Phr family secreted Rap phosphatase inhibitor n=1 Tax=Bacillus chungangensis TaxID=587633 RepID=A0ABT9WVC2_9BACI|nr:hypothetical protein [Bacillus chungangensis]MDQ0177162.1 hypothetical protein [Bacillus chungangensis]
MKKLKMLAVGVMAVGVFVFGSMNIKESDHINLASHGNGFSFLSSMNGTYNK